MKLHKINQEHIILLARLREEDGILIREMKNHCRCLMASSKGYSKIAVNSEATLIPVFSFHVKIIIQYI
uniref:Uncharacterized protein n=1 Tax=Amphiprion percula TaxID=161767 RepID=A0A3P8U889_AMPPE